MECSCCFPITYLLPCRHVMCLNNHLMGTPFVVGQVDKRWLRQYKPPANYDFKLPCTSSGSPSCSPCSSSPVPINHAFLSSAIQAGEVPVQRTRFGELKGLCDAICWRGAGDKSAYFRVLARVKELCQWVEAETSAPPLPPPTASAGAFSCSPPAADDAQLRLSSLHPVLSIAQTQEPAKPKRRKGREEGRTSSQGEKSNRKRQRIALTQQ